VAFPAVADAPDVPPPVSRVRASVAMMAITTPRRGSVLRISKYLMELGRRGDVPHSPLAS
jgi:hypothetical protein